MNRLVLTSFYTLKVPQQPNTYDCGLYPGHFLSVFLSNPARFAAHCTVSARSSDNSSPVAEFATLTRVKSLSKPRRMSFGVTIASRSFGNAFRASLMSRLEFDKHHWISTPIVSILKRLSLVFYLDPFPISPVPMPPFRR